MEAIQLANTKIDEIRTEFSRWLLEQSSEFKERLAKRYNETFNCFVRPQYNGAHQDFPGLYRESFGTGVNAQKKAVAVHHLDTPWRPSDLQQRDGRAIRKGNEVAKYFADNKVDVIIYAVEKSLDSYKFNLLFNKQLFIDQLKNNKLGKRTIDEGAMDEKSGMNYSEYVAILSGNTDLLDKAKLEKRITSLESERQSFHRAKSSTQTRLAHLTESLTTCQNTLNGLQTDWEELNKKAILNPDGSMQNCLQLTGLEGVIDIKQLGEKLNHIAKNLDTNGEFRKIGELYGFQQLAKTNIVQSEGLGFKEIKFYAEGAGGIKYTHNNGTMAADPKLAASYFIRALEKLPTLIDKEQQKIADIQKDLPVLQEILSGTWNKEAELTQLKTDLAAIDRRILLSITPESGATEEGEAVEITQEQHTTPEKQEAKSGVKFRM